MLQTSHTNSAFARVYSWQEQPRRTPSVARCLFGRPNQSETKKKLDEEIARNCRRFASRYEICQPSSQRSPSSSPLSNNEDSRRKRVDSSSSPKRQKLLTGESFLQYFDYRPMQKCRFDFKRSSISIK